MFIGTALKKPLGLQRCTAASREKNQTSLEPINMSLLTERGLDSFSSCANAGHPTFDSARALVGP